MDELPRSNGQEFAVLELLAGCREKYGLEMVKLEPKRLGRASIYVVLTRMVARGMLEDRLETDAEQKTRGPKRRLYKITGYGLKIYRARMAADAAIAKAMQGAEEPIR